MISIQLTRIDNCYVKLSVYGHAGYDDIGKDIVCASVSILTQSIIIGLFDVINKDFYYNINEKDASVFVDISKYNKLDLDKAQILFKTFKYTIDKLVTDYGKYIKFKIKEEQRR